MFFYKIMLNGGVMRITIEKYINAQQSICQNRPHYSHCKYFCFKWLNHIFTIVVCIWTHMALSLLQKDPLVSTVVSGPKVLSVRSTKLWFLYLMASLRALKRMQVFPLCATLRGEYGIAPGICSNLLRDGACGCRPYSWNTQHINRWHRG